MQLKVAVHCSGCGHENSSQYRFCGMCGLPLPRVEAARAAVPSANDTNQPKTPAPPLALDRVSLLGLETEPDNDLKPSKNTDYLLEEIKPPRSVRMHLALAVLLAAAALMGWKWHRDGYPWVPRFAEQSGQQQAVQSSIAPTPADPVTQAATPPPTPAVEPPQTSKDAQSAVEPPAAAPSDVEAKKREDKSSSGEPAAEKPSPVVEATANPESSRPALVDVARTRTSPAHVSRAPDDTQLLVEGEKYLYGNGVAQDCDRAQKSLLAAAAHSSTTAESLLGTMYASGHCASRDLPTAYHWYARALQHDPANTRIESDLKVIWQQMTPAERQVAGGK
jgi:hypothetical protein